MKAHVLKGGIVVNTIEVVDLSHPVAPGESLIDGAVGGIGWAYVGGQLLEPAPPAPAVPNTVSRYQALAALMQAGLLDAVTAWAHDPGTDPLHKLAFDTATEFARTSATLAAGATALGWTGEQLDALFVTASKIEG